MIKPALATSRGTSGILPDGPGKKLLVALERRIVIPPQLRQQVNSLPYLAGLSPVQVVAVADAVVRNVWLFSKDRGLDVLLEVEQATDGVFSLYPRDTKIPIEVEASVVTARQTAMALANKLGFRGLQQTKVATATSELARNIHMYAGRGEVQFNVLISPRHGLVVEAIDSGPGIPNVDAVLKGEIHSRTGLGLGIRGVKSIADEFGLTSAPGRGTRVRATFFKQ